MVWYIGKIDFETRMHLTDIEEKIFEGGKVIGEIVDNNLNVIASFVEGAGSSFFRVSEEYVFSVEDRDDPDRDGNYQYSLYVASVNPDVKRKVMERSKNYLINNKIKFMEENN